MDIGFRDVVEYASALFKYDDYIDLFNIPVCKTAPLYAFYPCILSHDQVGGVTGDALRRERVALFLYLHVDQGAVFQFPQHFRIVYITDGYIVAPAEQLKV